MKLPSFLYIKKFVILFIIFIFFAQLSQVIYFNKSFFIKEYDINYWKDRYEHSQYTLPLSKRIIGDEGLFAYAGYRLVQGDKPFSINVDKPPFGKYLIGFSILAFKNPAYYAFLFGIGCLIIFYAISINLFKDKIFALGITTILFVDPLFFTQFWKPWLDISQLFFLFLNVFFVIKILSGKNSNIILSILAGLALGFFAEIKPPILFPIIFILEILFLLLRKHFKECLLFIIGIIFGVFIPYYIYFKEGLGILEILKFHKFMTSFYLQSQIVTHKLAIWQTLLTGNFPDISTGLLDKVSEWWILWPIITIMGIIQTVYILIKKNKLLIWKGISIYLLLTLLIYTFIPSYPRYLIIVLPFLYLLSANFLNQIKNINIKTILILLLILLGFLYSFFYNQPNLNSTIKVFYYSFSHQYFQDIFQENLAERGKPSMTRDKFRFLTQESLKNATIKAIEIKELSRNISPLRQKGTISFEVKYTTQDLGQFTQKKIARIVKEDEQWKIIWDWNLILDGFSEDYKIETKIIPGKRGSIIDDSGNVLVADERGYLISVNPEKINLVKEQEMLKLLSRLSKINPVVLQNAYLENVVPGTYAPLFTLYLPLSSVLQNKLLIFPGIKIEPHNARIYSSDIMDSNSIKNTIYEECCTRIYSAYNYHGVSGIEKKYDSILWGHSGGTIEIKDKNGKTVKNVLSVDRIDGDTVKLSL